MRETDSGRWRERRGSERERATGRSGKRCDLRQQRMMTTEAALICRPAFTLPPSLARSHTQRCDCSSLFLSPFGFLPACCLATRTPCHVTWLWLTWSCDIIGLQQTCHTQTDVHQRMLTLAFASHTSTSISVHAVLNRYTNTHIHSTHTHTHTHVGVFVGPTCHLLTRCCGCRLH